MPNRRLTALSNTVSSVVMSSLLWLVMATPAWAAVALEDPLGGASLEKLLTTIVTWLTGFVGILALVALVYGGFKMVTAFGNDKAVAAGKTIIMWAVFGIVIVALAYVIVTTISQGVLDVK